MTDVATAERMEISEENKIIIEQMMRQGSPAPEPQGVPAVVHSGDDEQPAPMLDGGTTSAGYTYIYDPDTGERSITNNNMLPVQLRKKKPDGRVAFTIARPKNPDGSFKEPIMGTYKCMLHAENALRTEYDRIGLPTCPKSNLMSEFQVEQHMQTRHPRAWKTMEYIRQRAERDADKLFQRNIVELALRAQQPAEQPQVVDVTQGV